MGEAIRLAAARRQERAMVRARTPRKLTGSPVERVREPAPAVELDLALTLPGRERVERRERLD
jgi:hypothetical protein